MSRLRVSIPGIGGSLGECVVCGESFVAEILLGQRVDAIGITGIAADLPVHEKCGKLVVSMQGPWREIRETFPKGPLYRCFEEEHEAEREHTGNE